MIIEYRQRHMTLIQTPAPLTESIISLTPSLESLHIISPKPEALPIPPWFLDDLSKDLPPNPPNSLVHFPMKILHSTTTGTPQYFYIWFMSSEPSQSHCIVPPASSSPKENHMVTVISDQLASYVIFCAMGLPYDRENNHWFHTISSSPWG